MISIFLLLCLILNVQSQSAVSGVSSNVLTASSKILAPYVDILLWPTLDVSQVLDKTGVQHYSLSFIYAGTNNQPAWGGVIGMEQNFYAEQLSKLRQKGGDAIVSFGGAIGQELAIVIRDVNQLANAYEQVINRYNLTYLDFDIEGPPLLDKVSNDNRNQALVILKNRNPRIKFSYTLPTLPGGLTADGLNLLRSAVKFKVPVDRINLMTMNFGPYSAPNGATGMGGYSIEAAKSVYSQAQSVGMRNVSIGITPMIGQNDVQREIFRQEDARQVVDFASRTPWVTLLSYWSMARDTSAIGPLYASSRIPQSDYEFASIFKRYVSAGAPSFIASTTTAARTSANLSPRSSTSTSSTRLSIFSSPTRFSSSATLGSSVLTTTSVARPPAAFPTLIPAGLTPARPIGSLTTQPRMFAPYVDIMQWPTFDVSKVAVKTGVLYYTLAFICSGIGGKPAWGGSVPMEQNFYRDQLLRLRQKGGDAVASFGGAFGQELALVIKNVDQLAAAYQQVIDRYNFTYLDYDIEGAALGDISSIDIRNHALVILKKKNPKVKISYTLPVLPSGLTAHGVNLLASSVKAGLVVDRINLMTMDYGRGAAPNGATGMGGYAIDAAKSVYAQAQKIGMKDVHIGITPMIGQNDVQGEVFRQVDARQVVDFALLTPWVSFLSFWSLNRDNAASGPLFKSSQIAQSDLEFTNIFKRFVVGASSVTSSVPIALPSSITQRSLTTSLIRTSLVISASTLPPPFRSTGSVPQPTGFPNLVPAGLSPARPVGSLTTLSKTIAPYADILLWPTLDISQIAEKTKILHYTLAFIFAGANNQPAWGGVIGMEQNFYVDQLTRLRQRGGDAIVSFGGANGQEIAIVIKDVERLATTYQQVADRYNFTYLDFDIEGAALADNVSNDIRNQALSLLKKRRPQIKISYTLPVLPDGLTAIGVELLKSAVQFGLIVDRINLMTMNYGPYAAPNGATGMGGYTIDAAKSVYEQAQKIGMKDVYIGITPMIGQNDVQGEIFRQEDARQVVEFSLKTPWISLLSYWSISRDTSASGPLYASSQISQTDYEYAGIFRRFVTQSSSSWTSVSRSV